MKRLHRRRGRDALLQHEAGSMGENKHRLTLYDTHLLTLDAFFTRTVTDAKLCKIISGFMRGLEVDTRWDGLEYGSGYCDFLQVFGKKNLTSEDTKFARRKDCFRSAEVTCEKTKDECEQPEKTSSLCEQATSVAWKSSYSHRGGRKGNTESTGEGMPRGVDTLKSNFQFRTPTNDRKLDTENRTAIIHTSARPESISKPSVQCENGGRTPLPDSVGHYKNVSCQGQEEARPKNLDCSRCGKRSAEVGSGSLSKKRRNELPSSSHC